MDVINVYKDYEYKQNASAFEINETLYIEVGSKKSISSPMIILRSDKGNVNLSLTEVMPGLYRGSVKAQALTIGGNYVTLKADIARDGIESEKTVYVKDAIFTYKDNYSSISSYFKKNDVVYIEIKSVLANNESKIDNGTITLKSSLATKTLIVLETGVNTSLFKANITLNASGLNVATNDRVTITSNLGNICAAEKNITVDTTKPSISSYSSSTYVSNTVQTFYINVSDNVGVSENATIYYWRPYAQEDYDNDGEIDIGEGESLEVKGSGTRTSKMFSFTIDCTDLKTGENVSFWIDAQDLAGNKVNGGNWSEPLHTFIIDASPPTIEIYKPYENEVIRDMLTINVTFNDSLSGVNLSRAKFFIYQNNAKLKEGNLTCREYSCENKINISDLPYGYLTLKIRVKDNVGNSRIETLTLYHKHIAEKRIDFEIEAINITLEAQRKTNYSFTIVNKGNVALENISVELRGINYSLLSIPEKIEENGTVTLTLFSKNVGKKDVVLIVSAEKTKNVTISVKTIPNEKQRKELKRRFLNLSKTLEEIRENIERSKNEALITLFEKTQEELRKINESFSKDYYYAFFAMESAEKNVASLESVIGKGEERITLPWYLWIVILIMLVGILIYLFWPVRE